MQHEQAYIPTQRSEAQAHTRFPCSHGHQERPHRIEPPPRQRPQASNGLIAVPRRTVLGICVSTPEKPVALAAGEQVPSTFSTPSNQCFTRQQRLLLPREYKAVFDGNTLKASHASLLLLVRVAEPTAPARLGLVIAKKHVRLAVQRNRVKRQLRESFRRHQHELIGLDIVALARAGLGKLDNAQLRAVIDAQWQRLLKQKRKQEQNREAEA